MDKQSPLSILFCFHLLHSLPILFLLPLYPCLSPPLRVSGKPIIVKLTGEKFKICYIFKIQWFTSLLQCVSIVNFFNRNLFESPTNNKGPNAILKLFRLPKVILSYIWMANSKSLWYIISAVIDFSYCQTLWLVRNHLN